MEGRNEEQISHALHVSLKTVGVEGCHFTSLCVLCFLNVSNLPVLCSFQMC